MHVQEHETLRKIQIRQANAQRNNQCSLPHKHNHIHTKNIPFFPYSPHSTFDSTMKKRETVKAAAATASNSDDETNENAEKNENGDENASPEKSKATDSQAENAENIDTNGTADKPAEDGHDDDKEAAANDVDKKKAKINGKKAASDKKGSPRKFIRLTCVHCRTKAVTFEVKF